MLNKSRLKNAIKGAFNQQNETDADTAAGKVADALADAIISEIKELTIIYSTGLAAPPSGGTVTGTFEYTLS